MYSNDTNVVFGWDVCVGCSCFDAYVSPVSIASCASSGKPGASRWNSVWCVSWVFYNDVLHNCRYTICPPVRFDSFETLKWNTTQIARELFAMCFRSTLEVALRRVTWVPASFGAKLLIGKTACFVPDAVRRGCYIEMTWLKHCPSKQRLAVFGHVRPVKLKHPTHTSATKHHLSV